MTSKIDILLHPIRMKIIRVLMIHKESGLSTLQIKKELQDVSQATLYRHLQKLEKSNIIYVLRERNIRAVTEKYYTVNMKEVQLNPEEWNQYSVEAKLDYYSYFQLTLLSQYQSYLDKVEKENKKDLSTLSSIDLKLNNDTFNDFQEELYHLMMKYHDLSQGNKEGESRTIGITIIP